MTGSKRHICVVTGGRAEYGLLRWLIKDMREDPELRCSVIATGAHLVPEAGLTYREIEADGITVDLKVEIQLASDTHAGMAKSTGLAVLSFTDALMALKPDIVVVLGDRYEICAVALAAFLLDIPVAHLYGGEKTEGAMDDALRHAITKFSRFHFTASEPYCRRVIQLGEAPETVFNVGAPGLDNLHRLPLLDRAETLARLGLQPDSRFVLVTYHPVTAGEGESQAGMAALLEALDELEGLDIVMTRPNLDAGARALSAMADDFAARHTGRVVLATSLGQVLYLSAMRACEAVIGNSSSGIVEAPALQKPTVDIGTRQKGRLKATSIIECNPTKPEIATAIARALSPEFRAGLADVELLYGDLDASRTIHRILKSVPIETGRAKVFHDL
ncbi:MAG TPA: UDP-N-acetylglucosamine 2-epimerase [Rhabdaerophilum sp.]|nr:UDP-N-acetylglucosamine 2-epimerase [Rhabdaerophilum sp.]